MLNYTADQRKQLRIIKTIYHPIVQIARNTLVCGCLDQGAYIQFGRDVQLYNLWEALLYAEGYETGKLKAYRKGTAQSALDAAIKALP